MDIDLIYDDLPSVPVWFQNLLNKEEQLKAKNHKDDLSQLEDTNEFVWPSKSRYVFNGEIFQHLIMTSSKSDIYTDHHEMRRLINLAYQRKNKFELRSSIPADSKKYKKEFNQKLLNFVWIIFHLMIDDKFEDELPIMVTKYLNDPAYFILSYFCVKTDDSNPDYPYRMNTYWNVSCSFQTIIPKDEKGTIFNLDFMINTVNYTQLSLSEYIDIEKKKQQEKEENIMKKPQCIESPGTTPITPDSSDNEMNNDIVML